MDGGIKFDVSANTAKFEADMGRVKNAASTTAGAIGKAFSGLGGLFAGGALVAGLTTILRKMDDVSDMARRFGTTAVEIQKVGNAAEIVGTSVDAVARAMNRAGVAANKAAREGGSLAEAFARVDIDPAKFAAAGLEERIKMVAEAQRAANGDAKKMADLFEVIGVRAAGINFAELVTEMEQVNAASNETVEALAQANDQLDKMKQNATIFGANLVKGITDFSERIGSLLAGQPFETITEADQRQARLNAEAKLRARGELLPDDSTIRRTAISTPAGPVYGGQEKVLGPNAQENERRISAEMEKMRKAAEGAETAASGFVDELEAATPEADKTTKALERQAQLLEESNAKRRKAYETEVALTEARLTGNKALEESILQEQDFNQVLEETDSFETAANVTATRSAARKAEQTRTATGATATFAASYSKEQQSIEERIGAMRGAARSAAASAAAERFEAAGQFRSAVRAQDRAQRRVDRAMESARVKDILGGKNMGEAYQDYVKSTGLERMSRQDFEKSIRDQAKSPEERARAEQEAKKKGGKQGQEGGKSADPQQVVTDIYKLLTERLPIRVLAA